MIIAGLTPFSDGAKTLLSERPGNFVMHFWRYIFLPVMLQFQTPEMVLCEDDSLREKRGLHACGESLRKCCISKKGDRPPESPPEQVRGDPGGPK